MMKRHYIQSLDTLRLIIILAVVASHFWMDDVACMQGFCASFLFLYSGFFTAASHRVDGRYGLGEHARFLRDKLAKLYPLHVLALALCMLAAYLCWGANYLFSKVTLAHLALISSWIPTPGYYFGINPVAWYICDLFFLYLISSLIIKLLRRLSLSWQVIVVMALVGIVMLLGYGDDSMSTTSSSLIPFSNHYFLYEFPPVRILDFATGVVLYHITQGRWWSAAASRLTPSRATLVEVGALVAFWLFYQLGKTLLHPHWYRAFCSVAPAAVTLFGGFVLTSGKGGVVSRLMSRPQLALLSGIGAEIFLLQLGVFALVRYMLVRLGMPTQGWVYFMVQSAALLIVAAAVHYGFVKPLYRWLKSRNESTSDEKRMQKI